MSDESLLFLLIILELLFIYRFCMAIFLLAKKRYLLDEKYYISFLYLSLVGILVFFSGWIIVGIILVALLPIILTLYIAFNKSRIYWIINGYELSEGTIINHLSTKFEDFNDGNERIKHFRLFRKVNEKRTKVEFQNLSYERKEAILKELKSFLKDSNCLVNKREIRNLIINLFLMIAMAIIALVVILI